MGALCNWCIDARLADIGDQKHSCPGTVAIVNMWQLQDQWHLITSTMEIDPSPTRPNDELEFIELTGINDHALDQELMGLFTEGIQAVRNTAPAITKS